MTLTAGPHPPAPSPASRRGGVWLLSGSVAVWLAALLGALVVFGLFVATLGQNPLAATAAVATGAFGTAQGLNRTIARAIPLLLLSAGLVVAWILLVVVLLLVRPKGSLLREAMRILPDTLRLLRRLSADRSLPRAVRVRLWLLFAYLAIPIDLIPDFLPVIGYADDAVIVAVVLRSVVRRAGGEAIGKHWPGSEDGLATLWRVARLSG